MKVATKPIAVETTIILSQDEVNYLEKILYTLVYMSENRYHKTLEGKVLFAFNLWKELTK